MSLHIALRAAGLAKGKFWHQPTEYRPTGASKYSPYYVTFKIMTSVLFWYLFLASPSLLQVSKSSANNLLATVSKFQTARMSTSTQVCRFAYNCFGIAEKYMNLFLIEIRLRICVATCPHRSSIAQQLPMLKVITPRFGRSSVLSPPAF